MNLDDFDFHDSEILEVKEIISDQNIDYFINYPIDWANNIFETRILRFNNVIFYLIEEIPFTGPVTILKIENLGQIKRVFGKYENQQFESVSNKIELQTNAGKRIIEFSDCEWIISK